MSAQLSTSTTSRYIQGVSRPLMRTERVFVPQSISLIAWMMFLVILVLTLLLWRVQRRGVFYG